MSHRQRDFHFKTNHIGSRVCTLTTSVYWQTHCCFGKVALLWKKRTIVVKLTSQDEDPGYNRISRDFLRNPSHNESALSLAAVDNGFFLLHCLSGSDKADQQAASICSVELRLLIYWCIYLIIQTWIKIEICHETSVANYGKFHAFW